jgi:hypothetical protein
MGKRKMTQYKNIHMALVAAQLQMGPVLKSSNNPHFKSKYADLSDVMDVALPALNSSGISAWSSIVHTDGNQFMRTTLSHGESDTHISCDVALILSKNDMQAMKSATTYAKRIGIESLTGIAPEDDDGNAAGKNAPAARPAAKPDAPTDEAVTNAKAMLVDADDMADLARIWGNIPKPVQHVQSVCDAKDARKAELQILAEQAQ